MKILYFIHINWYWIFQRPQILALLLQKDFKVTVYNKQVLFKKKVVSDNEKPLDIHNLWQLPKEDWSFIIKLINKFIIKLQMLKSKHYDAIWICHPSLYQYIPSDYKGKIIYDCMDNHVALAIDSEKEFFRNEEAKLVERADLIFASSNSLKETIPGLSNALLIRNGFVSKHIYELALPIIKSKYSITYIGTVDSWFDYDLMNKSSEILSNIKYDIIGPVRYYNANTSVENINYVGVVKHQDLYSKIKNTDALIMPFIVNDIILSVDPVKLYEYISFGKCIISVWYPEIDRFSPFVYFYRDHDEYISLVKKLSEIGFKPKYSREEQLAFLQDNSWESRYSLIKSVLV